MKIPRLALALLVALGCGSDDDGGGGGGGGGSSSSPQGTWLNVVSQNETIRAVFSGSSWELDDLMLLDSGRYGMEVMKGSFTQSGSSLLLKLAQYTCHDIRPVSGTNLNATFRRNGTALELTLGGSAYMVMQQQTSPPTGMGSATLGCEDAGKFYSNPLGPAP